MTFDTLSRYATDGIPFLFYTDFKAETLHVYPLHQLAEFGIAYVLDSEHPPVTGQCNDALRIHPVSFESYQTKFEAVIEKIRCGDTYLLNLTQPTLIDTELTLREIFHKSDARFKLCVDDAFVCFSPERFVRIEEGRIHTFPMKGTIDASLPDAEKIILADAKERAEHVMIVDLLRNDLGMVARDITVKRFRYVEQIRAGDKSLLQVSSHISGDVGSDWKARLGEILQTLLPAGSISGTPKRSTVEIIDAVEGYTRGYFTGVFGVFDGAVFDSAVMIRYIEKVGNSLVYKSGGGITIDSEVKREYQEMLDKVYIG